MQHKYFFNEGVDSNYEYPPGYTVKSIPDQISILQKHLGGIITDFSFDEEALKIKYPEGYDGQYALINWKAFGISYEDAVNIAIEACACAYDNNFINRREGALGPDRLRWVERDQKVWELICAKQDNNAIIIVPCQTGLLHRGRSAKEVRLKMDDTKKQFGLNLLDVLSIIITHKNRLQSDTDLRISCIGNNYSPGANDCSPQHPFLFYDWAGVNLLTVLNSQPHATSGPATAFNPYSEAS
jgi:hypothetical protein